MNLRGFYRLSAIVILAELALAAWGLARVGLQGQVPVHWDVNGNVDGYAPAWMGFLLMPVVTVFVVGVLALVPRVEPRIEHLRSSASAYRTVASALVVFMGVIDVATTASGMGADVPVATIIGGGIGLLFAAIGNVLTTVRSNFMFGIRTPWTLSSERSWDKTHRVAGRLFVVTGLLTALIAVLGPLQLVIGVMLVMTFGTVILAFLYSYATWKSDPDRRPLGGS